MNNKKIKKLAILAAITTAAVCSTVSAMDQEQPRNHNNHQTAGNSVFLVRYINVFRYICNTCGNSHSVGKMNTPELILFKLDANYQPIARLCDNDLNKNCPDYEV